MAPFIEVLTRTYKRPGMLERNRGSLLSQTFKRWQQTLLVDEIGIGVPAASEKIGAYAPLLVGEYIWILDDDDICVVPELFQALSGIVIASLPDVIMLKMDHGPRGILPDLGYWEAEPEHGHIGISAYVIKRELWQQCAGAWMPGAYHSDYNFIKSIFETKPSVYWYNVIASKVQRVSLGQPEEVRK